MLDPFCGSGTTCVAAKILNRKYIGIDISKDAIQLAKKTLDDMIVSESQLMKKGKEAYIEKAQEDISILESLNAIPVQRNSLIDGYLKDSLIPITIQRDKDTEVSIAERITKIYDKYSPESLIFIQKHNDVEITNLKKEYKGLQIVKTLQAQIL